MKSVIYFKHLYEILLINNTCKFKFCQPSPYPRIKTLDPALLKDWRAKADTQTCV